MMVFCIADVMEQPELQPMMTLLSPEFNAVPALQPIAILKQVSESDAAPAFVPAYKFP